MQEHTDGDVAFAETVGLGLHRVRVGAAVLSSSIIIFYSLAFRFVAVSSHSLTAS
jgi:hypothetical protein